MGNFWRRCSSSWCVVCWHRCLPINGTHTMNDLWGRTIRIFFFFFCYCQGKYNNTNSPTTGSYLFSRNAANTLKCTSKLNCKRCKNFNWMSQQGDTLWHTKVTFGHQRNNNGCICSTTSNWQSAAKCNCRFVSPMGWFVYSVPHSCDGKVQPNVSIWQRLSEKCIECVCFGIALEARYTGNRTCVCSRSWLKTCVEWVYRVLHYTCVVDWRIAWWAQNLYELLWNIGKK